MGAFQRLAYGEYPPILPTGGRLVRKVGNVVHMGLERLAWVCKYHQPERVLIEA